MLCSVNNVFDSTVLQTHNILLFCVVLLLDVKKEKKESVPEMYEGFLFIYLFIFYVHVIWAVKNITSPTSI